jgi:hypothetical protein
MADIDAGRAPQPDADQLEAATDQAIAACGGDAREAVQRADRSPTPFSKPIWRNLRLRFRWGMREANCCRAIERIGTTEE